VSLFPQTNPELSPLDVVWMMTQEYAERNFTKAPPFPAETDIEMLDWFKERGGELNKFDYPSPDTEEEDDEEDEDEDEEDAKKRKRRNRMPKRTVRNLVAAEPIEDGELVMRAPMRTTLSQLTARNVKVGHSGYLGDRRHLRDAFKHNQAWGLAMMLLYEYYKDGGGGGEASKWHPYLKTLRLRSLTKKVIKELQGTYAAELQRSWDEEAKVAMEWLAENICKKHSANLCKRNPDRPGSVHLDRGDMKWALSVVRNYAIQVKKQSTGKLFLALVPFLDLMVHRKGSGGEIALQLDNSIVVRAGAHKQGAFAAFDHGALGDAETLLMHQFVSKKPNRHNFVRLRLPGKHKSWPGMPLYFQLDTLRDWRKQMSYPPRLSDMYKAAEKLHLYGDEEDTDEQDHIGTTNSQLAALATDEMTAEEVLMIRGYASTAEEAQLMVRGTGALTGDSKPQLYMALDVEDDEKAGEATTDLADMALQLTGSVALSCI
jgi:hypothetical protein